MTEEKQPLRGLQRNDPANDGVCKYALIRLDKMVPEDRTKFVDGVRAGHAVYAGDELDKVMAVLVPPMALPVIAVELQQVGDREESFVLKLKDRFSAVALYAYAEAAASAGMTEYAEQVKALADRAGPRHPHCKIPD